MLLALPWQQLTMQFLTVVAPSTCQPSMCCVGIGSLLQATRLRNRTVCVCVCVKHRNLRSLQRALEDGLFSIEDEDGLSRPNMTAVLVAAKQVRISA